MVQKEYPDQVRAINAFEAVLLLARGEQKPVADRLTKAIELVKKQPAETPLHEALTANTWQRMWRFGSRRRALARTLAQELVNDQQPPRRVNAEWTRRVVRLRATAVGPTIAQLRTFPLAKVRG